MEDSKMTDDQLLFEPHQSTEESLQGLKNKLNVLIEEALSLEYSKEQKISTLDFIKELFVLHSSSASNDSLDELCKLYCQVVNVCFNGWVGSALADSQELLAFLSGFIQELCRVFPYYGFYLGSLLALKSFFSLNTIKAPLNKALLSCLTAIYPSVLNLISGFPNNSHPFLSQCTSFEVLSAKLKELFISSEFSKIFVCNVLFHSDSPGLRNMAIKWIYDALLCLSSLSISSKDGPPQASDTETWSFPSDIFFKNEALKCLDTLLSACHSNTMTSGNITAILNLLSCLLKEKPQYVPQVLPVILDMNDNSSSQFSQNQAKTISHTLKVHLYKISKNTLPLGYLRLIGQILNEIQIKSKTKSKEKDKTSLSESFSGQDDSFLSNISSTELSSSSLKQHQQQQQQQNIPNEEMERLSRKQAIILSNRKMPIDIVKFPINWIIEIVIGSLLSKSQKDIDESFKILNHELVISPSALEKTPSTSQDLPLQSFSTEFTERSSEENSYFSTFPEGEHEHDTSSSTAATNLVKKTETLEIVMRRLFPSPDSFDGPLFSHDMNFQILWTHLITKLILNVEYNLFHSHSSIYFNKKNCYLSAGPSAEISSNINFSPNNNDNNSSYNNPPDNNSPEQQQQQSMDLDEPSTSETSNFEFGPLSSNLLHYLFDNNNGSERIISRQEKLHVSLVWMYKTWLKYKQKAYFSSNDGTPTTRTTLNNFYKIYLLKLYQTLSDRFSQIIKTSGSNQAPDFSLGKFLAVSPIFSEEVVRDSLINLLLPNEVSGEGLNEKQIEGVLLSTKALFMFKPTLIRIILPYLIQCFVSPVQGVRRTSIVIFKDVLLRPLPKPVSESLSITPASSNPQTSNLGSSIDYFEILKEFISQHVYELKKLEEASIHGEQQQANESLERENLLEQKLGPSLENVAQLLDLYLAICEEEPHFLTHLYFIYNSVSRDVQTHIRSLLEPLIKKLYFEQEAKFIEQVLVRFPPNCEPLFLRVLSIIVKISTNFSPLLVSQVKKIISERALDAKYMIPLIPGLEKPDLIEYFPKFLELLSGKPKDSALVKEIIKRMMSPLNRGALTPVEILIGIHDIENVIGLKRAIEATQICFSMPEIFKQEVLAATLQKLVEKTPIATIFMRTAIQALNLYNSLSNFMTTILFKLVSKKIWMHKQLWEGFIKICQIMQPNSLQILIQLPSSQLSQLLESHQEFKMPIKLYLQQQPPSFRNRFQNVIELLKI